VAGATPHCYLMSYAAAEDGREIYMITHKNTKKYKNLEGNPGVSLLIDSQARFILGRVKAFQLMEGLSDAYFEEVN